MTGVQTCALPIYVVLLDIRLGNDNGIDILKHIKQEYERTEVIMITVVKDIRTAVEAIKYGAYDYINKDFNGDELKLLVDQALKKQQMSVELHYLRNEIRELTDYKMVIGHSPLMKEIEQIIRRIAKTPSNVLIQGESGTGKEVVARKIHELSQVGTGHSPFVSVNVASIPSELIESILFGHEKGSLPEPIEPTRVNSKLQMVARCFLMRLVNCGLIYRLKSCEPYRRG